MWHLVADTACDLFTLEDNEKKENEPEIDFATIPFSIRIGDTEYIDTESIPLEEMLTANENHSLSAQTACPSPEAWREQFEAPGPVLAFTISSALSGSYNSACTAKTMVQEEKPEKDIAVIDSKATGPEEAMLIWKARDLIRAGARTVQEVAEQLNREAEKLHTIFALASYHNLIRAGRVSRLIGFIAGHLGFWGIGIGDDKGEIAIRGKARGSRHMVRFLVDEVRRVGLAGKQIVISHCQNEKDALSLRDQLQEAFAGVKVVVMATRGLDSFYAERRGLIVGF